MSIGYIFSPQILTVVTNRIHALELIAGVCGNIDIDGFTRVESLVVIDVYCTAAVSNLAINRISGFDSYRFEGHTIYNDSKVRHDKLCLVAGNGNSSGIIPINTIYTNTFKLIASIRLCRDGDLLSVVGLFREADRTVLDAQISGCGYAVQTLERDRESNTFLRHCESESSAAALAKIDVARLKGYERSARIGCAYNGDLVASFGSELLISIRNCLSLAVINCNCYGPVCGCAALVVLDFDCVGVISERASTLAGVLSPCVTVCECGCGQQGQDKAEDQCCRH